MRGKGSPPNFLPDKHTWIQQAEVLCSAEIVESGVLSLITWPFPRGWDRTVGTVFGVKLPFFKRFRMNLRENAADQTRTDKYSSGFRTWSHF